VISATISCYIYNDSVERVTLRKKRKRGRKKNRTAVYSKDVCILIIRRLARRMITLQLKYGGKRIAIKSPHKGQFSTLSDQYYHYIPYCLLTPWCSVFLEKLTGLQVVKKFPAFHGNRRFNTALKRPPLVSILRTFPTATTYNYPTRPLSFSKTELS